MPREMEANFVIVHLPSQPSSRLGRTSWRQLLAATKD
ncbi:Uncharacterised protein [Vibrio cholerae]|nr:Uncharacterised protein [Vibrio cholerae]